MIDDNVIKGVISVGVDYYKGEKGEKGDNGRDGYTPRKGIDYFTESDIDYVIGKIENDSDIATVDDIPTKLSDLENDLDIVVNETDPTVPAWAKQESKPTYTASEVGALPADTVIPIVPSNVSAFTNDAGYLTEHQSLTNYATKSYVEEVAAGIETGKLKRSVVEALPVSSIDEYTIYMIPASSSTTNDVYDEYMYVDNAWEKIGNTAVDLTDYVSTTAMNAALAEKQDNLVFNTAYSSTANKVATMSDIPAEYVLPVATTSTLGGVKVDGETLVINDGVLSTTGGNGSSSMPLEVLLKTSSITPTNSIKAGVEFISRYEDKADLVHKLKANKIVYISNAPYATSPDYLLHESDLIDGSSSNSLQYIQYDQFSAGVMYIASVGSGYSPRNTEFLYWDGEVLHCWKKIGEIIRNLPIDSNGTKVSQFAARVPANASTTAGNYKLTSTVPSSGSTTYSWVEDSNSGGGASYTAGTNIVINNDTISTTSNASFNVVQTGSGADNYFQCRKFRGEGDANTYYHAIDFGYSGHNKVEFYDYGGEYIFYQNTQANNSNPTELLRITPSSITYKGTSLLSGGGGGSYTLPTASTTALGGVKVDGTSITIDANGVISSSATGGGASYTAGNGIDITNNVISTTGIPTYTAGSNITISNSGVISATGELSGTVEAGLVSYSNTASGLVADNVQDAIDELIAGGEDKGYNVFTDILLPVSYAKYGDSIKYHMPLINSQNELREAIDSGAKIFYNKNLYLNLNILNSEYGYTGFQRCFIDNAGSSSGGSIRVDSSWQPGSGVFYLNSSNNKVYYATFATNNMNIGNVLEYIYFDKRGKTVHQYFNMVDTLNKVIPSAPSNNGDYKLNCSISSGTATYSWEEDSGSGNSNIPSPPSNDGNYILTCSISSGTATYSWVSANIGGSY